MSQYGAFGRAKSGQNYEAILKAYYGDIKIEKENFRFYFPLTTMILFSLVVNLVIRLVRWLAPYFS